MSASSSAFASSGESLRHTACEHNYAVGVVALKAADGLARFAVALRSDGAGVYNIDVRILVCADKNKPVPFCKVAHPV